LLIASLLLLAVPRAAGTEVRVIDVSPGASATLVTDARAHALRWTDDGTALLVGDEQGEIARIGVDGGVTA
jgi:hypothetical protein